MAALGEVDLREAYLIDQSASKRNFQYGEYFNGCVTINPAALVVPTLVHELLHHIRPEWTERGVTTATNRIIRQLEHDEVGAMYGAFCKRLGRDA